MFSKVIYKKIKWALIHFILGLIILSPLSLLVFNTWFIDGRYLLSDLFGLVTIIFLLDLALGPLLSLWLLSPVKSRKENTINIGVILFLQFCSLGYGLLQVDSQRLAYFIKWQGSYFAITKGESRKDTNNEQFYIFNEPEVGSKGRLVYEKLIQEGISPVEMHEFFILSSFESECETICGVITKKGIVNVIKVEGEIRFNKSLH